jgi:ATP-dependent DNA helicase RecG
MTNCWQARSRSRSCARICAGRRTRQRGDGQCTQADRVGAALFADIVSAQGDRGIVSDLGKPERMLRMLQGDVGSGKTVVALMAAPPYRNGRQAALMAPTEILARASI